MLRYSDSRERSPRACKAFSAVEKGSEFTRCRGRAALLTQVNGVHRRDTVTGLETYVALTTGSTYVIPIQT